jgi:hypothetical protein
MVPLEIGKAYRFLCPVIFGGSSDEENSSIIVVYTGTKNRASGNFVTTLLLHCPYAEECTSKGKCGVDTGGFYPWRLLPL